MDRPRGDVARGRGSAYSKKAPPFQLGASQPGSTPTNSSNPQTEGVDVGMPAVEVVADGAKNRHKRPNQAARRQMQASTPFEFDAKAFGSHPTQPNPGSSKHGQEMTRNFSPNQTRNPAHHQNVEGFHGGAAPPQTSPRNPRRPQSSYSKEFGKAGRGGYQASQPIRGGRHYSDQVDQNGKLTDPQARPRSQPANHYQNTPPPANTMDPRQPPELSPFYRYTPHWQRDDVLAKHVLSQAQALESVAQTVVQSIEIGPADYDRMEAFRCQVQKVCRAVVAEHEFVANHNATFPPTSVDLQCFGSLASGFATKSADMDLGLLSPLSVKPPDAADSPIPRLVEKALLDEGFGARLLSRARVPIIKLCESPNEKLRHALLAARESWERGLAETTGDEEGPNNGEEHVEGQLIDDVAAGIAILGIHPDDRTSAVKGENTPAESSGSSMSVQAKISACKQGEDQSLSNYFHQTRTSLIGSNGNDQNSEFPQTTPASLSQFQINIAFIDGLRDPDLKRRVKSSSPFIALNKTLYIRDIWKMVEGESIAMMWEANFTIEGPSGERTLAVEHQSQSAWTLQLWSDFMNMKIDTMKTDDDKASGLVNLLHDSFKELKAAPAVRLLELEQGQFEQPNAYYQRVASIHKESFSEFLETGFKSSPELQCVLQGIRPLEVSQDVIEFVRSTRMESLQVIEIVHNILQLASEYSQAIAEGSFSPEDIPFVEEYVRFLRREIHRDPPSPGNNFRLRIPDSLRLVFGRIRALPDPSRLAPNRPDDRHGDNIEFPERGIGVQCDITFSPHLALQNTHLLRCYTFTDPRVRPFVIFIKHWAKARGINSPYRGTLSSYGYVLMCLHYLINIAQPFVCPNLQHLAPPDPPTLPEGIEGLTTCQGHNVRFWRNEHEIQHFAALNQITPNQDPLGLLLRGFFEYYAYRGPMTTYGAEAFEWARDAISLRTQGGLLPKAAKGWTATRTVVDMENAGTTAASAPLRPEDVKISRNRYIVAIEDPFDLEHNVARTVTHDGVCAIRDEFRRAWQIIRSSGTAGAFGEDLVVDKLVGERRERMRFWGRLDGIHGV